MFLGILFLLLVELQTTEAISIGQIILWLVLFFVIPLTLLGMYDEVGLFTGGTLVYMFLMLTMGTIRLIEIPKQQCCHLSSLAIVAIATYVCLVAIGACQRDLKRYRKEYF